MKKYLVTLSVYFNCSISHDEDFYLFAKNEEEAEERAKRLADAMELIEDARWESEEGRDPDDERPDFWVHPSVSEIE